MDLKDACRCFAGRAQRLDERHVGAPLGRRLPLLFLNYHEAPAKEKILSDQRLSRLMGTVSFGARYFPCNRLSFDLEFSFLALALF